MLSVKFTPFPILETGRLVLRRINSDDSTAIFKLRSNEENMKYVPRPVAKTKADALVHISNIEAKIVNNEGINWAITLKDSNDFIGIIGHYLLRPEHYRSEIGYMMLPEFQGRGIMTEAISKVMDYGFEVMGLHSVEAIIDPENQASAKVLENNGFVKEAHLKENEYYDGKFIDTVIYSKLNPAG